MNICFQTIAGLPSRVLLPEVCAIYSKLTPSGIVTLLNIVEIHIEKIGKEVAVKQQTVLQDLFLMALDYRSTNTTDEASNVLSVESSTCKALVKLSLKLPEASLRPLLFKIFSWATTAEGSSRLITLFALYENLADSLKSMFPLFLGSLANYLINFLPKICGQPPIFDSPEDTRLLLVKILNC